MCKVFQAVNLKGFYNRYYSLSPINILFFNYKTFVLFSDLRFPLDGAVELHFSATPDGVRFPSPAPTPAVPVDLSPDPVTRWDSYENLMQDTDTDDINGKLHIFVSLLEFTISIAVTSKCFN